MEISNLHLKMVWKFFVKEEREKFAKELARNKNALFINEGVAQSEAELGFITQANEIMSGAKKVA